MHPYMTSFPGSISVPLGQEQEVTSKPPTPWSPLETLSPKTLGGKSDQLLPQKPRVSAQIQQNPQDCEAIALKQKCNWHWFQNTLNPNQGEPPGQVLFQLFPSPADEPSSRSILLLQGCRMRCCHASQSILWGGKFTLRG